MGEANKRKNPDGNYKSYKGNGYKWLQAYDKMSADDLVKIGWSRYIKYANPKNWRKKHDTRRRTKYTFKRNV